jgi:hypothetical protein
MRPRLPKGPCLMAVFSTPSTVTTSSAPVSRRTLLVGSAAGVAAAGLGATVAEGVLRVPVPSPDPLRGLIPLLGAPLRSIAEVARKLAAVGDYASAVSPRGDQDGIASFARLYRIITDTVDARPFADRAFLVRLDIEFARRYFAALRAYALDPDAAPRCWRVLFDRRLDPAVEPAQFAAAGVNAHINYDLAVALLATFPQFPPSELRRGDYDGINDVFALRMRQLRQLFASPLSAAPPVVDRGADRVSDLLVRGTRTVAWDLALQVWNAADRAAAATALDRELDRVATVIGGVLLDTPLLPL